MQSAGSVYVIGYVENSLSKNCTFLNFIQKSKDDYDNEYRWKIDAFLILFRIWY